MKRTFHLFSLAIIVSLLFSAVGLPLIPVQAAGATANLGPTGFRGKLSYPSAPTIASPAGVTNDSTPTIQGAADPGNRVTVWYDDSTTADWVLVCEDLLADSSTGDWTCPWPAAPFLPIAAGNFSLKAKAFDGTNYSPDTIVNLELNLIGPNCIEYRLTVTSANGTVTKKPNKATYRYGEIVQLTAAPAMGWSFANWTGDVTGTNNPVFITINGDKAVTANYIQTGYTLTVTSDHGNVLKNPDQATYHYGDVVTLTAIPTTGWSFGNWTGDVTSAENSVSIIIDGDKAVTANYIQNGYTLTVTSAHGNVLKNPDQATYHYGDVVTLTAIPATGWSFLDWTGDLTNAENPVSITIDGDKAVTANYIQAGYTLAVNFAHGTVTKTPNKATYSFGEVVQVNVTDTHDWLFVNWTGDMTATTNPLSITMDSNKTITANFIGRGPDTAGVFRPTSTILYLKNRNETGFADIALHYGLLGDYPVVGDWDGDGDTTIGVYRNGYFYLRNENTIGFAEMVFLFGAPGDQPIAGDWDANGTDTIGVYRPSTGQFLLRNSNSEGAADASFYLGNLGDVGIAGDWDGDGIDTTGVFRPSNGVIFLKNNNNETGLADVALNYGLPGDKPVTGDWDDDGVDTIGVYRNNTFYLRNSNTNGFAELVFVLGLPGDMPIAGNWDGLP